MPDTAKYEAYRIQQPVFSTGSLFNDEPTLTLDESRIASIRAAVEYGRHHEGNWKASRPDEIEGGLAFMVGYGEVVENWTYESGDLTPKKEELYKVTDVFLDYSTGRMLIRRAKEAPGPWLISQAFKSWLKRANDERQTGFDSIVQPVPLVEDFLEALRKAKNISRLSFVVHGPNPADEKDFLKALTRFTEEHQIQTTSVALHAASIDPETAQQIAAEVGKKGDRVSATIEDPGSSAPRNIQMRKKPRSIQGPERPSPREGRKLLDSLKALLNKLGVGKGEGD